VTATREPGPSDKVSGAPSIPTRERSRNIAAGRSAMDKWLDRDRLAKLLGMLGSRPAPSQIVVVRPFDDDEDDGPKDVAELPALLRRLLRDPRLTEWERGFCQSLLKRRKRLTFKQRCVLN
jgi:hypothetical protein